MLGWLQPAENLDLAAETGRAQDRRELRPQDLDGHPLVALDVLREIDPGHASAAQLLETR